MSPSEKQRSAARLSQKAHTKSVLVIHGGAGAIRREGSTVEQQQRYRVALRGALQAGHQILATGGEAMDAVVAAVSFMEDCPLFNSGKGAVFTRAGTNELEASLMLSKPPSNQPLVPASRRAFALTLLSHTKNPIKLARALYLDPHLTVHALLSGNAAEKLGESLGVEMVNEKYFWTEARWREHRRGLGLPEEPLPSHLSLDADGGEKNPFEDGRDEAQLPPLDLMPQGTVGAVALDERGCIAAATSTGGLTNKIPGRIGDTPQLSAGFYAQEWSSRGWIHKTWRKIRGKGKRAVGISGTGNGDYFIRQGTAISIAHRMMYLNESLDKSARKAVRKLAMDDAQGGVIAIDDEGNWTLQLNCPGMYRGVIESGGEARVAIFNDEELA